MTAKEYLEQAHRLNERIQAGIQEAKRIRSVVGTPTSPKYSGDGFPATKNTDAKFVIALERMWDMEEQVNSEVAKLTALKKQIHETIQTLENYDEQMVLYYRYELELPWEEIGKKMFVNRSTVHRWHKNALTHIKLPDNPIRL